jgi:hypothetical protein
MDLPEAELILLGGSLILVKKLADSLSSSEELIFGLEPFDEDDYFSSSIVDFGSSRLTGLRIFILRLGELNDALELSSFISYNPLSEFYLSPS